MSDPAIARLAAALADHYTVERELGSQTTANLQHAHILPLHDSGTVNGTVFYVMPFVEGESLRDRLLREKQLPGPDPERRDPAMRAVFRAIIGDHEGALEYLRIAVDRRSAMSPILCCSVGFFKDVQSDPRFERMVREIGIEPWWLSRTVSLQ